jgi:hypothetical protein
MKAAMKFNSMNKATRTRMKLFFFIIALMFFIVSIASNSLGGENQIPLPGAIEIKKYISDNLKRFNNVTSYPEIAINITCIEKDDFSSRIFNKHCIFKVTISEPYYLEIIRDGSIEAKGYFASDGKEILYLNHSNLDNIEKLFKEEYIQIEKSDIFDLCWFLSSILLTDGPKSYEMIQTNSELIAYAQTHAGYEVNDKILKKLEKELHPPKVSGNKEIGWEIEFFTYGGPMHDKREVRLQLIQISPQYKIRPVTEILTTQAFSKIPEIIY